VICNPIYIEVISSRPELIKVPSTFVFAVIYLNVISAKIDRRIVVSVPSRITQSLFRFVNPEFVSSIGVSVVSIMNFAFSRMFRAKNEFLNLTFF